MAEEGMAWDKIISEIRKILFDIKLSFFFLLVISFVLFIPKDWADFLAIDKFRTDNKQWISMGFILFIFINFIHFSSWLIRRTKKNALVKLKQNQLHHLSPAEKGVLSEYITKNSKTENWRMDDGIIGGLVQGDILWRSSNLSAWDQTFAFNIKNWVWDYLKERPELLD